MADTPQSAQPNPHKKINLVSLLEQCNTQDDTQWVVRAELPGVKAADISISVLKNHLTISGKREKGDFERTFALPQGFDVDRVEAKYADGVLTVVLPKPEKAQPRQIAIKVG